MQKIQFITALFLFTLITSAGCQKKNPLEPVPTPNPPVEQTVFGRRTAKLAIGRTGTGWDGLKGRGWRSTHPSTDSGERPYKKSRFIDAPALNAGS